MTTLLFSTFMTFFSPHIQDKDQALWLARSCVGEAGWGSAYTGECVAIAYVYRKRAILGRKTFRGMMHRYSAAIRSGRPWLRTLDRSLRRPRGLKKDINWKYFREHWRAMLEVADAFMRREVADPLPSALHYGGDMDRGRLDSNMWRRIDAPEFENEFYEMR